MEIKSSLELIIFDNKRQNDFYQNYININSGIPSFNLFFLSAIFSSTLINIFSFQGTVILIFVSVSCVIGFGLDYFDFHSGETLNDNYSFKENIILILIYILIYTFIGNIALIPHDILQKGYILLDLQYDSDKKEPKKNGYIFTYLFSLVVSSFIKMILDRKFVFDEVKLIIDNKTSNSFFSYTAIIILIYFCSVISSSIFFWIYRSIFTKIKKDKNNTSHKAIKIFGYLIYWETTNGCCVGCLDCQKATKKCSYCLGFHECECCRCCYQCCEDWMKLNMDKNNYVLFIN